MEAQGTLEQLNQMLKLINQGTYIQVEDLRRKTIPLDREANEGFMYGNLDKRQGLCYKK